MQLITVALSTLTLALGVSAAPVPNALEGSEINARSFIDVAKQFASPHIGPGPVVFNSSEIASTSQNSGISGTAIFTLPGHIPNPHIAPPIGIFAPPVKNLRSEEHARAIIEEMEVQHRRDDAEDLAILQVLAAGSSDIDARANELD